MHRERRAGAVPFQAADAAVAVLANDQSAARVEGEAIGPGSRPANGAVPEYPAGFRNTLVPRPGCRL
jgi:hypothetical protein